MNELKPYSNQVCFKNAIYTKKSRKIVRDEELNTEKASTTLVLSML